MEALINEPPREMAAIGQVSITVERVAYLAILVLSLVLRLANLDTVPLTDSEARQALATWRFLHPETPGGDIVSDSPVTFMLQNVAFTLLGASEMTARVLTALGGTALVLSPILFRRKLGSARAFAMSLLLGGSPVLLVASRTGSPVIWSALFAVVGLWALWDFWDERQPRSAVLATVMLAALIFLAEPGGLVLATVLASAGAAALWLTALDAPDKVDLPGNEFLGAVSERFRRWPWQWALIVAGLVVIVVSTGFMFYPRGFDTIGELLGNALRGMSNPKPGALPAFPLVISVFYEPHLAVFALIGIWLLRRRGDMSLAERFVAASAVIATLAALLYRAGGPDHALWLTLPMAALASYVIIAAFVNDDRTLLWDIAGDRLSPLVVPRWSKWLVAVATMVVIAIGAVHLQQVGRSLVNFPQVGSLQETFDLLGDPTYNPLKVSAIWVLLSLALLFIGYLLAASLWGGMAAAQGAAIGLLAFSVVTSLGSGWSAAVPDSGNPVEPWHTRANTSNVFLLRQTLLDLAMRETGGFDFLPVTVVTDPEGVITEDGVIAWMLRDFPLTRFVPSESAARTDKIIVLKAPIDDNSLPDLGASYVGQRYVVSRVWDPQTLRPGDLIGWWTQRRTQTGDRVLRKVVLWVRQDVFEGVPADQGPGRG